MPARDARTGTARAGSPRDPRSRAAGGRSTASARRGDRTATARRDGGAARRGRDDAPVGEGLVVGPVPPGARAAGLLLVLAAVVGAVSIFPRYLDMGGTSLTLAGGVGGALIGLLAPAVSAALGTLLARGVLPKLGLAYAAVAGSLALGQLLVELHRGQGSVDRSIGVEAVAGELVLTSGIRIGAGWVLGVVALGLTVLAGGVAAGVWGRTVMEDGGALDAVRAPLAGASLLLGVGTVLCMTLPAADVPDDLAIDPLTGLEVVVTREGPQGLLERPGLGLLGGLLIAGALVLCAVIAPSLRPRPAAVGGLLAITVTVVTAALTGLRNAVVSDELDWTIAGVGLLVAGLGFAVLTVLAWRLNRR